VREMASQGLSGPTIAKASVSRRRRCGASCGRVARAPRRWSAMGSADCYLNPHGERVDGVWRLQWAVNALPGQQL
jgi:hypothetical protein